MAELDDCVERKIPKLIEEGMSQEQATAAAHSMCEEDHKAMDDCMKRHMDEGMSEADAKKKCDEDYKAVKMVMRPTQMEAGYVPLSTEAGKACANCRFFDGDVGMCALIENYPDSILPTGYCQRWETPPSMEAHMEQMPATTGVIVEGSAEAVTKSFVVDPDSTGPITHTWTIPQGSKQQSLIALIKSTVGDLLNKRIPAQSSGFKVYGNHWVGWWTNNAEDREAEWFPAKAIDDYVDRVDVGVIPQPDLWFWHIPGSRHGTAEWQGRIEHYCVAVGSFDETPAGTAARKHYTQSKARYSMSHGFAYDKSHYLDGAYHQFNTFELSVLPPHVAANPYTDFEGIKTMALTPEKVQALEALVGKEIAQQIIADTEAKSKALDELGVQFKDYLEVSPTEAPASKEAVANVEKDLTGLFVDILKDQAGMVTIVDAMGKAFKVHGETVNALIEGFKTDLTAIQEQLDGRSRIASKDAETVVDESKVNADTLKDMKQTKIDNFWNPAG
jgi:hypothetical protein